MIHGRQADPDYRCPCRDGDICGLHFLQDDIAQSECYYKNKAF